MSEERIYSVSEFIDFINELLVPQHAIVQGEVNQVKSMNGYTFFTLIDKNEESALNCFVWQNKLDSFGVELKEGLELKVEGFPKIYKRNGRFNIEVEHIGLVGEGVLKQAFEILKKKLTANGYFEPDRKKPVPKYVQRIGLITSNYADAKNDFLTHLGKYSFKIYFYDVRVEGLYAINEISSAIRWFNENMGDIEVLVLTRGGGSLESLQPFNSETITKAIFASKIPVATAIGHENNETIADLVADVYTSTPTDAARILSDPWRKAHDLINSYESNIFSILKGEYVNTLDRLASFESSFSMAIDRVVVFKKDIVKSLQKTLLWETKRWFKIFKARLESVEQSLRLSEPTGRLKQGYSIIFNNVNKVVKSSRQIMINEEVFLKFYEGNATTRVVKKKI